MALLKSFETKFKQSATYWKMSHFEKLDFLNDQAIVILLGYESKKDRLAGEFYLDSKRIELNGISGNTDNIRKLIYGLIKNTEEFIDSIDI